MGPQISVIGASAPSPELERLAEEAGRLLAKAGCVVVCGGLGGVMAAASKGATAEGGTAVGVLSGESRCDANRWVSVSIATGAGHARNLAVVASGDAVIAIGGEWGTVSEIALACKLGRSVILLEASGPISAGDDLPTASTPEEAVAVALAMAVATAGGC